MRFRLFAWGVLGGNLFVILWGAFVRASGSGAGCGRHWPLCNGAVIPTAPATATLIELTHRITSGIALALVAALFWWSRREFARGHPARRWAAWSLVFICLEALIGAGLVLLELVAGNASLARAGYLAAHLLNTFLLLGALALTVHHAIPIAGPRDPAPAPSGWLLGSGLVLLLLVGMSGAVAALGDTLFPVTSLGEGLRADQAAGSHLLIRLRGWHPLLAGVTGAYLVIMVRQIARSHPAADAAALRAVLVLVAAQLSLGVINLLLLAPIALQLGHLLLADLLWISVVLFAATTIRSPVSRASSQPVAPREAAPVVPGSAPGR